MEPVQPASNDGLALLRSERRAFRRRVLLLAAGTIAVLGPVFALTEWSEQTLTHNLILLGLTATGFATMGLIRAEQQRAAVVLLVVGVTPVVGWIHLFGRRADLAVLYLVPLLVTAMITSESRTARWLYPGLVVAGLAIRAARWGFGIDTDVGVWTTWSFDTVAILAITGGMVWMGLVRMQRDEAILRTALADRERLTEVARAASDEKSAFLARISHELRTPLNAVLGYAELMEEEEAVRAENAADLERIQQAASQLLALIDAVLDLSKVEAGHMELHVEPTDLAELLEAVRGTALPLVRRNGNALVVEDDGPEVVHIDRAKVTQILLNLLSNAARFTRDGTVTLRVTGEPGVVVFAVSDTGIGIPAERIGALFEPFVQASATTARDYGGTGLGLALCDRFVRQMGGHIEVESTPGEGLTFRVTLPDGGGE